MIHALVLMGLLLDADPTPVSDSPVVHVEKGMLVPFDGVLETDAQAIVVAKRLVAAETAVEDFKAQESQHWSPVLIVAIGVVVLGAGVGIGYGIHEVVKK